MLRTLVNRRRLKEGSQPRVGGIEQHLLVGVIPGERPGPTHPPPDPLKFLIAGISGLGETILIVHGIHQVSQLDLLEVIHAARPHRLGLGFAQRRQEHARQDRDDRNHHQQLDEGERCGANTKRR